VPPRSSSDERAAAGLFRGRLCKYLHNALIASL